MSLPAPPVANLPAGDSVPSAARENATTSLCVALVCTKTAPSLAMSMGSPFLGRSRTAHRTCGAPLRYTRLRGPVLATLMRRRSPSSVPRPRPSVEPGRDPPDVPHDGVAAPGEAVRRAHDADR